MRVKGAENRKDGQSLLDIALSTPRPPFNYQVAQKRCKKSKKKASAQVGPIRSKVVSNEIFDSACKEVLAEFEKQHEHWQKEMASLKYFDEAPVTYPCAGYREAGLEQLDNILLRAPSSIPKLKADYFLQES